MAGMALNDITRALEVLDCNIDARPASAPAIGKIAQLARSTERRDGSLAVTFDAVAASEVERFAAGEQTCCATLKWDVRANDDCVELTVRGSPEQLDLLEKVLSATARR